MIKDQATAGNISKGTEVLCMDPAGKFKAWHGIVKSLLAEKSGEKPEAAVVFEGDDETKDAVTHVVRIEDLCPANLLPVALLDTLTRANLLAAKPFELAGRATAVASLASTPASVPEETETLEATGEPVWLSQEINGVPDGFDWSQMVGTPFHDQSRRVIGLVVRAGQGKAIVAVKRGMEKEVREMLAAGALPGSVERPEPKAGDTL